MLGKKTGLKQGSPLYPSGPYSPLYSALNVALRWFGVMVFVKPGMATYSGGYVEAVALDSANRRRSSKKRSTSLASALKFFILQWI